MDYKPYVNLLKRFPNQKITMVAKKKTKVKQRDYPDLNSRRPN